MTTMTTENPADIAWRIATGQYLTKAMTKEEIDENEDITAYIAFDYEDFSLCEQDLYDQIECLADTILEALNLIQRTST